MGSKIVYANYEDLHFLDNLGLSSAKKALTFQNGRIATINRGSDTLEIPAARAGGPASIFLKRYRSRRWAGPVKQMFRGGLFGKGRARYEFDTLGEMRRRGLPVVRPIAFGQRRKAGFVYASFLITEGVPGAESLDSFASRPDGAWKLSLSAHRRSVSDLALVIRRMHQAGVRHGALFWRNVLVTPPDNTDPPYVLLDPDPSGRISAAPLSDRQAADDLSRLFATAGALRELRAEDTAVPQVVSRTDLIRFAQAYWNTRRLTPGHKRWVRDCLRAAETFIHQERHRLSMGSLIKRLRTRTDNDVSSSSVTNGESIDTFLDRLSKRRPPRPLGRGEKRIVHLTFHDVDAKDRTIRASMTLDGGTITVARDRHVGTPDLTVSCGADVWTAILRGQADAFDLIRTRQMEIRGNTSLLAGLAGLIGF